MRESFLESGYFLIEKGYEYEEQVIQWDRQAKALNQTFVYFLVSKNLFKATFLAHFLAENFALPFYNLDEFDQCSMPQIPGEKIIFQNRFIPLFLNENHLLLGTDDPSNHLKLKEIEFNTGFNCSFMVVEADKLDKLLQELYKPTLYFDSTLNNKSSDIQGVNFLTNSFTPIQSDSPIVNFVDEIILNAIQRKASDIHLEPHESLYKIRYRLDGLLSEATNVSPNFASQITARIKIMSKLDIAEKRLPQDGRFQLDNPDFKNYDFRVNCCPTLFGEKIVIRVLKTENAQLDINELGFSSTQKSIFLNAINRTQGLILITGPTGSGKTLSLYTALNKLNVSNRNIMTAENPVEIILPGINQVNVNPKVGLTFANILRSFLRQDPDILMIGEIRDTETAEMAIKAAQTGHLVLSTLHTNNAAESITRLINLGISSYDLAGSLSLLVAQRLVRCLCVHCKIPMDASMQSTTRSEANLVKNSFLPEGCSFCNLGYSGRIGLFEIMSITEKIADMIENKSSAHTILKTTVQDGMQTLYQSGIEKVKNGITTLEEVNRVIWQD